MALRLKKLHEQTIVITGATAGIGLATARMAARHGARLVLAARDEEALRQLVGEIRSGGGEAAHVVADVGNERDVETIAATAIEQFGGFDTWVNNAGASIFGRMLDIPSADHRRLFETNFWGEVYGSLTAARHFRERRGEYGGVIINLGSLVSDRAIPIQGMYSASKHAVKGFTDALRMELEEEGVPVAVTLVKPASIATPFPRHAENTMAEEPTLPPPLYDPDIVARSILHCAETPRRDVYVGGSAKLIAAMGHCAPRLTDMMMETMMVRQQKSHRQEQRDRFAMREPATDLEEHGDYRHHVMKSSIYTEASLHPALKASLLAGAAIGIVALARRGSSR